MVMMVKRGQLPSPSWENLVMQRFPEGVQWSVTQFPEGFVAEVRGLAAPYIFEDWTTGLTWVAKQFGISDAALSDLKGNAHRQDPARAQIGNIR